MENVIAATFTIGKNLYKVEVRADITAHVVCARATCWTDDGFAGSIGASFAEWSRFIRDTIPPSAAFTTAVDQALIAVINGEIARTRLESGCSSQTLVLERAYNVLANVREDFAISAQNR